MSLNLHETHTETPHPFRSLTQPHSPPPLAEASDNSSLKCWRFQQTKLPGYGGPAGAVLLWELFYVKRVLLLKGSFNVFRFCQRGENPGQHRKPNSSTHNDTGALWRLCEGFSRTLTTAVSRDCRTHSRLTGPPGGEQASETSHSGISAPTPGGGPRDPQLCCTKLEAAGATGHGMSPHPGKLKALPIQNTVTVAVCPWLLGNRASNCLLLR